MPEKNPTGPIFFCSAFMLSYWSCYGPNPHGHLMWAQWNYDLWKTAVKRKKRMKRPPICKIQALNNHLGRNVFLWNMLHFIFQTHTGLRGRLSNYYPERRRQHSAVIFPSLTSWKIFCVLFYLRVGWFVVVLFWGFLGFILLVFILLGGMGFWGSVGIFW